MANTLRVVNWLTVLGGAGLLLLSLWPGFVVGCFLVLAYPLIFGLGLTWLGIVIAGATTKRETPLGVRAVLLAPIVVCTTYVALRYYIPRRVAFAACKGLFEQHVMAKNAGVTVPPQWMGIYRVDEVAADERGGVYFRTGTTGDGLGPDTLSYGFAFQPNRHGSPFGASRYRAYRMFADGDWYWFQASNDWFWRNAEDGSGDANARGVTRPRFAAPAQRGTPFGSPESVREVTPRRRAWRRGR